MTTIAYRDGVMAADSAIVDQHILEGQFQKCARVSGTDGDTLIGHAGYAALAKAFVDWIRGVGDKPELEKDDDLDALVVLPDGSVECYDKSLVALSITAPFYAIGTGRQLAYGAMAAGASAEEAVLIACRFDTLSSEPIATWKHRARLAA